MINSTEFKNYIDLSSSAYDDAITLIVAGVNKFIQSYCNTQLVTGEVTEFFDGDEIIEDDDNIFLSSRVNVSGLTLYYNTGTESSPTWVEEDRTNYVEKLDEGIVELLTVRSGYKTYKAVYTAGYTIGSDVPSDLKLGTLKVAVAIYNKRKSEGVLSEGFDGANINFDKAMTEDVKLLLSPYMVRSI